MCSDRWLVGLEDFWPICALQLQATADRGGSSQPSKHPNSLSPVITHSTYSVLPKNQPISFKKKNISHLDRETKPQNESCWSAKKESH